MTQPETSHCSHCQVVPPRLDGKCHLCFITPIVVGVMTSLATVALVFFILPLVAAVVGALCG